MYVQLTSIATLICVARQLACRHKYQEKRSNRLSASATACRIRRFVVCASFRDDQALARLPRSHLLFELSPPLLLSILFYFSFPPIGHISAFSSYLLFPIIISVLHRHLMPPLHSQVTWCCRCISLHRDKSLDTRHIFSCVVPGASVARFLRSS